MKYIRAQIVVTQLLIIACMYAMNDNAKNDPHFAYLRHVIEDYLKNLSEFDSIIDFGCRNGITTHYLYSRTNPKKTSKIIGLDPSVRHIIAAKSRQVAHLMQSTQSTANDHIHQLMRKKSFSSSPLQVSTLSSSDPIEAVEIAHADQLPNSVPDNYSFYQRTLAAADTLKPELDLSTSLVHLQNVDSRDRLAFYVDNLVTLTYRESRAQLVTSFNNIHTFAIKEVFFDSICKLFKDNGILLLTTQLESPQLTTILNVLQNKVTEAPWKNVFTHFHAKAAYVPLSSIEELKKLLKKYKFNKAEIILEERYCTNQQSVSSYLEHEFYAFIPFGSLSPEQKKQLCDSVAQEYIRTFPPKNGTIFLPNTVIVKAQRHLYSPLAGIGWKH